MHSTPLLVRHSQILLSYSGQHPCYSNFALGLYSPLGPYCYCTLRYRLLTTSSLDAHLRLRFAFCLLCFLRSLVLLHTGTTTQHCITCFQYLHYTPYLRFYPLIVHVARSTCHTSLPNTTRQNFLIPPSHLVSRRIRSHDSLSLSLLSLSSACTLQRTPLLCLARAHTLGSRVLVRIDAY